MELNVTCPILLTQDVLRRFGDQANARGTLKIRIVNISSLLAIQVMPSWSLYSVGKAARDMHMKSVAADARRSGLDVRTLSWAPGPMDTKMVQEVLETCPDTDVRAQFQSMYESGTLVDPRYSAAQLMVLLHEDFYENGCHKDIYDIGVPPPAPAAGSEQLLTPEHLAEVPQRMQKQLLGERLYPHVARSHPEIAGRITSMLLEMENSEVLMLLQSEQHLQAKVDEARRLLELYSNVSPPVNPAEIAGQPPEVQRQYFGERLYPRVARYQPELAGKITGMLLGLERHELLEVFESEQMLQSKVEEARRIILLHVDEVAPPCTAAELAEQPPELQKQFLGERLFPRVAYHQPVLAGKITGTLLMEMTNEDLMELLKSKEMLLEQVNEARHVIEENAGIAGKPPAVQKQIIGERLFPQVLQYYPLLAGKLTGMMLEMDNSDLLVLLDSPQLLKDKVEEAKLVLDTTCGPDAHLLTDELLLQAEQPFADIEAQQPTPWFAEPEDLTKEFHRLTGISGAAPFRVPQGGFVQQAEVQQHRLRDLRRCLDRQGASPSDINSVQDSVSELEGLVEDLADLGPRAPAEPRDQVAVRRAIVGALYEELRSLASEVRGAQVLELQRESEVASYFTATPSTARRAPKVKMPSVVEKDDFADLLGQVGDGPSEPGRPAASAALQAEEQRLLATFTTDLDKIQETRTKIEEVSTMVGLFATKVAEQTEQTDEIYDLTEESTAYVESAQQHLERAIQNSNSYRFYVVCWFIGSALFLLVFDYIDARWSPI
ncbi:SPR [Symbiodinium sp. CCMP2592]|nr:SPR [Symbiodinium sp. CCMP2592]